MTRLRLLLLCLALSACAAPPAPDTDCPPGALGGEEETDGGIGGTGHKDCP